MRYYRVKASFSILAADMGSCHTCFISRLHQEILRVSIMMKKKWKQRIVVLAEITRFASYAKTLTLSSSKNMTALFYPIYCITSILRNKQPSLKTVSEASIRKE